MNASFQRRNLPRRALPWGALLVLVACLGSVNEAAAQRAPRIGYIYPAGGRQDTTFEVQVGGQGLDDPLGAVISGEGVQVEILEHIKPLGTQAAGDLREKLRGMQATMRELRSSGKATASEMLPTIRRVLREAGVTERDLRLLADYDRRRNDPKQQQNAQIGESVRVKVTIAPTAEPGLRQWRLRTVGGLSNPMRFAIGQHPEIREAEAETVFDFEHYTGGAASGKKTRQPTVVTPTTTLPVTINGRILPGEVDEFSIQARKDNQIVVAVQARNLIPYLADAVPGWFQAVVSLTDPQGHEVAFADDYRFDPDPVLFYKIPYDGEFRIKVRDSIYRGREDFVYRITVGELPFLTGISPLGAKAGSTTDITFLGGNLSGQNKQRYTAPDRAGTVSLHATIGPWRSNAIPFQIDTLPEEPEHETNNSLGAAIEVKPPVVVNGRIETPGDADFFRIKGPGDKPMVFEIFARRLGSPLDASLTAFDVDGRKIGFNDDHEDLTAGLTTHHADARLTVKLPKTGICIVRVADTQNQSGYNHAYRLRIAPAHPGFALRVTPSTLNAKPGGTARVTVHALRTDGFEGEISLRIKDASDEFQLKSAKVPAGADRAEISVPAPTNSSQTPSAIALQGTAVVDGETLVVDAIPAEDMMQAFIYRHLVPVDALLIDVHSPPEKPSR